MLRTEKRDVYITSNGSVCTDLNVAKRVETRLMLKDVLDKSMAEYRKLTGLTAQQQFYATPDNVAAIIAFDLEGMIDALNNVVEDERV